MGSEEQHLLQLARLCFLGVSLSKGAEGTGGASESVLLTSLEGLQNTWSIPTFSSILVLPELSAKNGHIAHLGRKSLGLGQLLNWFLAWSLSDSQLGFTEA